MSRHLVSVNGDLNLAAVIAAEADASVGDLANPNDARYQYQCRTSSLWTPTLLGSRVVLPPTAGWAALNGGTQSFRGGEMLIGCGHLDSRVHLL